MSKFTDITYRLLFDGDNSGKVSHTRFYSNIGHVVAIAGFGFCVVTGHADTLLWLTYGTIILGNATANKLLNLVLNKKADTPTTTEPTPEVKP